MLSDVFTEQITKLPKIVVPGGVTIYLAKAETQVVYFLTAAEDLDYPVHAHAAQFAVVLEGCIEITTSEGTKSYGKAIVTVCPQEWSTARNSTLDLPRCQSWTSQRTSTRFSVAANHRCGNAASVQHHSALEGSFTCWQYQSACSQSSLSSGSF
jgi:hypothetical protein